MAEIKEADVSENKARTKGKSKDGRQIKLELKGDMRNCIELDAKRNFRSCTQQIYYILSLYYGEGGFGSVMPGNAIPQIRLVEVKEDKEDKEDKEIPSNSQEEDKVSEGVKNNGNCGVSSKEYDSYEDEDYDEDYDEDVDDMANF